jgi:putative copper export protein
MSVFPLLVIVHALAATVWTGGHLVLDLGVLPRALRAQSAAQIRAFEETFEPLGLTALAIQVLTGLWMSWIYLPGFRGLFSTANPIGMLVGVKLLLLAATAALAIHARLRLIPNLSDDNLSGLAWHIRGITALAIAFVMVGALIRLGAWAEEDCRPRGGASRGRQHHQQQAVSLRIQQPGLSAERFLPRRIF